MTQIKPPAATADSALTANPFFEDWATPDQVPPFDRIAPEHFRAAYARALPSMRPRSRPSPTQSAPPSFDNTIAALELSGRALDRVESAFHLLVGAHSNDALLEIERELSPQIARHWNKINTNADLFRRVDTLMRDAAAAGLTSEQKRVHRALPHRLPARGRGARRHGQEAACRNHRTARRARHRLQPECARRRTGFHAPPRRRGRACRIAGLHARGAALGCARARTRRPCGHAIAVERRAVFAILRPARSARKSVSRLHHTAATMAGRPTIRTISPR